MGTETAQKKINYFKFCLWLGSLFIVVGSIFMILDNSIEGNISRIFLGGMVLYIVSFWPYFGFQQPFKDERARMVGMRAGVTAFYGTVVLICALLNAHSAFSRYLSLDIGGFQYLGIALILLVLIMLISSEYYERTGDLA
jgi:hypothetical protein